MGRAYHSAREGPMQRRRDFLKRLVPASAIGYATLRTDWLDRVVSASATVADRAPSDVAADEGYWREVQQAFTLDRTIINLNNGYTCPSPRVVHEALKRYLDMSNRRRSTTCGTCWSRTSRACAASWRSKSAAIPKSSRSRATPARACRSPSSASICRRAMKSSPPTRITAACSTPGSTARRTTPSRWTATTCSSSPMTWRTTRQRVRPRQGQRRVHLRREPDLGGADGVQYQDAHRDVLHRDRDRGLRDAGAGPVRRPRAGA